MLSGGKKKHRCESRNHLTVSNAISRGIHLLRHLMGQRESARIRRERKTVRVMIAMYCRSHHGEEGLCDACADLAGYADTKLDRCPYGGAKPACTNCPIHCYRTEPRERMREVMRFAGPRMIWRHPYLAIRHLFDERKEAPELPRKAQARSRDR